MYINYSVWRSFISGFLWFGGKAMQMWRLIGIISKKTLQICVLFYIFARHVIFVDIMQVIPYIPEYAQDWDDVVANSANGTFQLNSKYMDYHRNRFEDACLLTYNKKGKPVGIFPANYQEDGIVVSHSGLTYGGLISDAKLHATDVFEQLDSICSYYSTKGCKKLIYKSIPYIYSEQPSEADLYWLTQKGAQLYWRTLSSAVNLQSPLPLSELRRRGVKKAINNGISVIQNVDYKQFWDILNNVLTQRFGVHAVHSVEEIELLANRFPGNISLYTAMCDGQIVAGTVVYASRGVAHAQYIAANEIGKKHGALDLIFTRLIDEFKAKGYRWFDFGISTEHDGTGLNAGLLGQKEGFGARSVCYDTYILNL